jgi:hypothetical protein
MSAAAALLILAAASAPPAAALECPAVPGQTLAYVDLFEGPPENQSDLAPDRTIKPSAGNVSNLWQLVVGPDGLYVKCGYGKSLAGPYNQVETIRLPATAKSCRADFKTGPGAGDLTLTHFACK